MKLLLIVLALFVTTASPLVWPWETLVCTVDCINNTASSTCQLTSRSEPVNVSVEPSDVCNSSFNFTITELNSATKCGPQPTATVTTPAAAVTRTSITTRLCSGNETQLASLLSELTDCRHPKGVLCWVLISLGCVVVLLLAIILGMCIAVTRLLAKGERYQYTPNVVLTQNGGDQNQINQEHQPPTQNQDQPERQQTNHYHILDPQYDTVDNKTAQLRSEPVHYSEPEPVTQVQAEVTGSKATSRRESQQSKIKTSLEKLDKGDDPKGIFYDELTGPGYPSASKGLNLSKHSAGTLPLGVVPNYSRLHVEDSSQQEQAQQFFPLYSMPDKSKKKEKIRETEMMATSQTMRSPVDSKPLLMLDPTLSDRGGTEHGKVKPISSSPTPPELPPKPGQTSKAAMETEPELDEEESEYAEVSSRPITSAPSHNRTPAAVGTMISPLHLASHSRSSPVEEQGSFRRSYSMEGYFGSEAFRHQKPSDLDFRRLYDAPMTPSLHPRDMAPPQERQEEEEEEQNHGFFRAS